MLSILIFGCLIYLWIRFVSFVNKNHPMTRQQQNGYKKILDCYIREEPHKWSYNKDDRLQCTECGALAGSYTDEGEE